MSCSHMLYYPSGLHIVHSTKLALLTLMYPVKIGVYLVRTLVCTWYIEYISGTVAPVTGTVQVQSPTSVPMWSSGDE